MTSPLTGQNQVGVDRQTAPRPTTQMAIGCIFIPLVVVILTAGAFIYLRAGASSHLTIPDKEVLLVRTSPAGSAPLLARFGAGQAVELVGRSDDWRWLEVELWEGQRGWALRPLDILVWHLDAAPTNPVPAPDLPAPVDPVTEKMISIPETSFTMGSPPGFGEDDERPAHPVTLSAFAIDRTEVTVGQYWACVSAEACAAPVTYASQTQPHYLNDPAFDNYPVINISWTEANNYCAWRGKRLPTEAEWELVAGWDIEKKAKRLWVWGNAPEAEQVNVGPAGVGDTVVVGASPADVSHLGVMDLGGNVSEWVFDWYKVDYYQVADDTNPVGPTHRRGEGSGRVVRGASFADSFTEARSTNRRHQDEGYGYPTIGFRCAIDE